MRGLSAICMMVLALAAIAPRATAGDLPASDLVKDCTSSMSKCNEDFVLRDLLRPLMSHSCGPDDPLLAQQEAVEWIARHPDEQDKEADVAVEDAKHALWSCMDNE